MIRVPYFYISMHIWHLLVIHSFTTQEFVDLVWVLLQLGLPKKKPWVFVTDNNAQPWKIDLLLDRRRCH